MIKFWLHKMQRFITLSSLHILFWYLFKHVSTNTVIWYKNKLSLPEHFTKVLRLDINIVIDERVKIFCVISTIILELYTKALQT